MPLLQPPQQLIAQRTADGQSGSLGPQCPQPGALLGPAGKVAPPVEPAAARTAGAAVPTGRVLRAVAVGVVAVELAPHRGAVPADLLSDLRDRPAHPPQCLDLQPFIACKLSAGHCATLGASRALQQPADSAAAEGSHPTMINAGC